MASAFKDLKEGFAYTLKNDLVRTLIGSSALFVFFGFSFVTLRSQPGQSMFWVEMCVPTDCFFQRVVLGRCWVLYY